MNPELLFPQPDRLDLPLVDLATAPFWAIFLAAVVLLPLIAEGRLRQAVLAFLNLAFVWFLYPAGLPLLMLGLAVFWACLRGISRQGNAKRASLGITVGLGLTLFVLNKRPDWASVEPNGLQMLNPILAAIAFSYVMLRGVEVYRAVWEQTHPCPTPLALVCYLLPFNMIAAGPIQSYDEFSAQPAVPPAPSTEDVMVGLERLSTGLFKKFVLAQALSTVFLTGFRNPDPLSLALEIQIFYVWLFLDFSGYTDVAVGVGRIVGISTPENFDHPFRARNIFDFWNRWHITLSTFIRVNIFIPMQVYLIRRSYDRSPLGAALISWFLAFVLSGLWHALNWPFFCWGLLHGTGLVICKLYETAIVRRWGRKGYKSYMANRGIHAVAVLITFEFAAFAASLPFIPWSWMWSQWTTT